MVVATKSPSLSVFSGSIWDQKWPAPNSEIMSRLDALRGLSAPTLDDRSRIKQIMDGGADGIKALLGDKVKGLGRDIPAPNLMASAMERLGQKLGRPPTLRTDPPEHKDTKQAKAQAERRRRIVAAYDEQCRLELQLPQAGRWLPGYGFAVWVVRPWKDRDGNWYPLAELRDPYDCFCGWFGPTQQPDELAIVRRIPIQALINLYPEHADRLAKRPLAGNTNLMGTDSARAGWENQSGEGLEVAEYYAPDGTWIIIPERELVVDWSPSILKSGPPFVVAKRFSFNQLQSQYHHVIGLMAQMAKINVLEMIAMEDAVFTETNIIGEPTGRKYQRGRFAVNVFPPGTEISKPMNQTPYQLFSAISQAERQLRIGAAYPVTDDSESPTQWTTGRGIEQLQVSGISNHIREYQTAIRYALQRLDAVRLEMDETLWPGGQKPLVGSLDGAPFAEKYRPSEIQGSYRTRRIYGAMAGFDDASKIIAGIQLKDAGIIDAETFQENLDGLENLPRIRDRITRSRVEEGLFAMLAQAAQQGEPKAQLAIVEIHRSPGDIDMILDKYFTPKEPQVSPEEQAYMQQMMQQQQMAQQGPQQMPAAPSVMSALTRLESNRGGTPR